MCKTLAMTIANSKHKAGTKQASGTFNVHVSRGGQHVRLAALHVNLRSSRDTVSKRERDAFWSGEQE